MTSVEAMVHLPLDMPDIEAASQRYGIKFVSPTARQLDEFAQLCDTLVCEQQSLLDQFGAELAPTKPAVAYDPSTFLDRPLTPEQTSAINERETSQIAAYCVGVQTQLAKVPIQESGERFQHIPAVFEASHVAATFSDIPFPEICGQPWANKPQEFWAREGFAKRLAVMGRLLNAVDVQLHFVEAFRPLGVQEAMFKRRVGRTRNEHPGWNEKQVIAESRSKAAYTPRLASHKGGAAADVLLQDMKGEFLDFGHQYPDGGVLVFPRTPYVTAEQWRNRQLLQVSAGLSGLTLYIGEDWHVSFGDNLASLDEHGEVRKGYVAQYGPIKDLDRTTGEITATYAPDELDRTFGH